MSATDAASFPFTNDTPLNAAPRMSAFHELRNLVANPSEEGLAKGLLGPQCLLLRAAIERRDQGDLLADSSLPGWADFRSYFAELSRQAPSRSPLAARQDLIRLAQSHDDRETILGKLRETVQFYHRLQGKADWSLATLRITRQTHGFDAATLPQPAWRGRLRDANWRQDFDLLAAEFGWLDPALALVGQTMAMLVPPPADSPEPSASSVPAPPGNGPGAPQPLADSPEPTGGPASRVPRTVQTSVLLSATIADLTIPDQQKTGLVAALVLTAVPGGRGYLYPDPLSMGYLESADNRFQESLRNAWFQVMRPVFGRPECDYDIVWSLSITHPADGWPIAPRVDGRSAELAIAAALRALREREDLDPWTVVTGMFAEPLNPHSQQTAPVEEVRAKLLAPEFGSRFQAADLTDLIMDQGQQPSDEQIAIKTTPHRVTTFDQVYENISRWAVMTRTANERLAEQAAALLRNRCHADAPHGYVPSPLSRKIETAGEHVGREEKWERLQNRDDVVTASWDARRVHFIAESGVGKTTFLIHCQQRIAESQTGLLPVRLDQLTEKTWNNEQEFYTGLAHEFRRYLPRYRENEALVQQWLKRLRLKGRLVFLLDAIDQTAQEEINQLHEWLRRAGGVQDCRVYVTGRPWTSSLRLFDTRDAEQMWVRLRVDLLDKEQIPAFLTAEQQAQLQRHFPEDDELLRVPVVLDLLRNLAAGKRLGELANRERIYQAAMEDPWDEETQTGGLIGKGLATVKDSRYQDAVPDSRVVSRTVDQLASLLGAAAWRMVRGGNFEGLVRGEMFHELADHLEQLARQQDWRSDMLGGMEQVGLFQLRDVVKREQATLEWRHLSFCEYFAGVHLAERLTEAEIAGTLAEVLDNLRARASAGRPAASGSNLDVSPQNRWRWVFRFALSRAYANARESGDATRLNLLARNLIAHGNPYVVYESIQADGIEPGMEQRLNDLARWLVHQTRDFPRDLQSAWQSDEPPAADLETLAILRTLFDRRFRNGPVLPPAWQLVESCLPPEPKSPATVVRRSVVGVRRVFDCLRALWRRGDRTAALTPLQTSAVAIRDLFLGKFDPEVAGERAFSEAERLVLTEFLNSFVACPPKHIDSSRCGNQLRRVFSNEYAFRMGAAPNDEEANSTERPRHWVRLRGFRMSEFCVTNGVLELMDPSHFWYRDQYSRADDQPALWVTWYSARLFGLWLTWLARRAEPEASHDYRLPTECEWEFAARGGSGARWWWGDTFEAERCNVNEAGEGFQTLGRSRTTPAHCNGFGLYHMAGNNWQWCADVYDPGWYAERTGVSRGAKTPHAVTGEYPSGEGPTGVGDRVCRGGSFRNVARQCRSSYRDRYSAVVLPRILGFRLTGLLNPSESSSDTAVI